MTSYTDTRLLIDGQWVDAASGKTIDVVNPATGKVIGKVAHAGIADLDVHNTPIRAFLWRRCEQPVDACSHVTCGAADEHGGSLCVAVGHIARDSSGMFSALRKSQNASQEGEGEGGSGRMWRRTERVVCCCARTHRPLTSRSASAPVTIFTLG